MSWGMKVRILRLFLSRILKGVLCCVVGVSEGARLELGFGVVFLVVYFGGWGCGFRFFLK